MRRIISSVYPSAELYKQGKKLFANIPNRFFTQRFVLGKYTYYLSKQEPNVYEVRRLSNTYNMNVIFAIQLKRPQDEADLIKFESEL